MSSSTSSTCSSFAASLRTSRARSSSTLAVWGSASATSWRYKVCCNAAMSGSVPTLTQQILEKAIRTSSSWTRIAALTVLPASEGGAQIQSRSSRCIGCSVRALTMSGSAMQRQGAGHSPTPPIPTAVVVLLIRALVCRCPPLPARLGVPLLTSLPSLIRPLRRRSVNKFTVVILP
eukprot:6208404-Prymnesium_polylepis.1